MQLPVSSSVLLHWPLRKFRTLVALPWIHFLRQCHPSCLEAQVVGSPQLHSSPPSHPDQVYTLPHTVVQHSSSPDDMVHP